MVTSTLDPGEFEEFRQWDPKTQAQVAAALEAVMRQGGQAWFCTLGRQCDGKPHEGYPYSHARSDQWPPEGQDWVTWLLQGGRGSGKTRSGSEWTRKKCTLTPRWAIIGPTIAHVRDVMVEGESGLLAVFSRAGQAAEWEPSKRKITLGNGSIIHAYSGEEPDRLRGPQHGGAWLDEPAHIPLIVDVWDNLLLGLRMGSHPRILCTTTPLPTKWLKELVKRPDTRAVRVSTYVNLDNLAPTFREAVLSKYEGTRLGKQELHGEILEDVEGALWNFGMIEPHRTMLTAEDMEYITIGVDPAGTANAKSDETGIIAVGRMAKHLYVLADVSGKYSPEGWAKATWDLFDLLGADAIVAEKNYGGEMVTSVLRNHRLQTRAALDGRLDLVTSRRGKKIRAEPIVAYYEQGRGHHVQGLDTLETEQTTWVPGVGDSPNRVDALVHAATDVMKVTEPASIASPVGSESTLGHDPVWLRHIAASQAGAPAVAANLYRAKVWG